MRVPPEFEEIRSFEDEDIRHALVSLFSDAGFLRVLKEEARLLPVSLLKWYVFRLKGIHQIQRKIFLPFLDRLLSKASTGFTHDFSALPDGKHNFIFLSNHRDIVLDSALLDYCFLKKGGRTPEIGIGDNLLAYPWIQTLVRLNRCFLVKRSLPPTELILASQLLSKYMRFVITEKKDALWLAQREGRAKDSDDRTQKSVLKMLAMSAPSMNVIDALAELNVVPLSISYEYDPCDYLKAKEFQQKRDNPDFKKSSQDDLTSMRVGIHGKKGRIHYQSAAPINSELEKLDKTLHKNILLEQVCTIIDRAIFSGYRFYPGNYVALDLLKGGSGHSSNYTASQKETFERYIESRLALIDLKEPDTEFLRTKLLEMYANPLINHLNLNKK